jgi:hypothetical protein
VVLPDRGSEGLLVSVDELPSAAGLDGTVDPGQAGGPGAPQPVMQVIQRRPGHADDERLDLIRQASIVPVHLVRRRPATRGCRHRRACHAPTDAAVMDEFGSSWTLSGRRTERDVLSE